MTDSTVFHTKIAKRCTWEWFTMPFFHKFCKLHSWKLLLSWITLVSTNRL